MSVSSRDRLLAELGITRYRLRVPVPVAAAVRGVEPAVPERQGVPVCLRLSAPAPQHWPAGAQHAWEGVLAWLALSPDEIAWLPEGDPAGVPLPAPADWSTAQGRRGLWLALKSVAGSLLPPADSRG